MRVVAGVTACNEERTIGPLLEVLLAAHPGGFSIERVIVVSSACTDGTDAIVKGFAARDARVVLLAEPVRRGKSAAIDSILEARPEGTGATLIASADVLPAPGAVESIVAALEEPGVGMAGGRPVPRNAGTALVDRMARLMWHLHDRVARKSPKLGEVVAFRSSLLTHIDPESPVDEASMEAEIARAGFSLRYVPEAEIGNRGPATLREWLTQRRRIAFGHRWLRDRAGYAVSTGGAGVLSVFVPEVLPHPSRWIPGAALVLFEAVARLLAAWDRLSGRRDHRVWTIAPSTKAGSDPR